MQTHSVSFDKNEGLPSMTSGMYPTNSVDTACKCLLALITDSHTLNEHDLCYIEGR